MHEDSLAQALVEQVGAGRLGVSEQTFYRWKKRFGALGVSELRELRQLRDENRKLKGLVADLTLDMTILHEALRKKW
jgi:putative transposase